MSNDNGPFSQKYISSRCFLFFFFLFSIFDNEPSEIWCYLREKKSKGRFFAFFVLFCFVLFFCWQITLAKKKERRN